MRSGFLPARVVHVHPTRACNLACAHCYSDSSPAVRGALDVERLIEALALLRGEGYEIVSISGGEPLVYRPLVRLAAGAAALGYRVHMITNGILLTEERLAALAPHLFLAGVSLDGAEAVHNAVRGRDDAYRHARRALAFLSQCQLPFGIIYAATAPSLGDIPGAFDLARELGAHLLHLRPLAPEGRARDLEASWALSPDDCARLYLLAQLLDAYGPDAPRVQVDLVQTEGLEQARTQFALLDANAPPQSLSDAVNPLVLDADGRCYPFSYGIDPSLVLADISAPLTPETFRLRPETTAQLGALLDATFLLASRERHAFVDWFALLTRVSRLSSRHSVATSRLTPARPATPIP